MLRHRNHGAARKLPLAVLLSGVRPLIGALEPSPLIQLPENIPWKAGKGDPGGWGHAVHIGDPAEVQVIECQAPVFNVTQS